MLPAAARLTSSESFRRGVREGRRAGVRRLVLHLDAETRSALEPASAAAEPLDGPCRVGFVVSRAVGGAVTRNRVRRRLRHLVRDRLDALPRGGILVVRALPPAATADFGELRDDLDRCLGRVLK